jgi:hypothetical protein
MSPRNLVVTAMSAPVLFDVVASFASLALGFDYKYAALGSLAVYAIVGFLAARVINFFVSLHCCSSQC